jgi:hypothetical protein
MNETWKFYCTTSYFEHPNFTVKGKSSSPNRKGLYSCAIQSEVLTGFDNRFLRTTDFQSNNTTRQNMGWMVYTIAKLAIFQKRFGKNDCISRRIKLEMTAPHEREMMAQKLCCLNRNPLADSTNLSAGFCR